jgi:hypothetical protein
MKVLRIGSACLAFLMPYALAASPPKPLPKLPGKPSPSPRTPYIAPAALLPFLPSIAEAKIEVHADTVVVSEDIALPKGDYKHGTLRLFFAFGGPGTPRAVDAHMMPVEEGELEASATASEDKLATEVVPKAPVSANTILGPSVASGVVVTIPEAAFVKATTPGKMAFLRMRWLYDAPSADSEGTRTLLLRVGSSEREPLSLGRIRALPANAKLKIESASAHLCGVNTKEKLELSVWGTTERYSSEKTTIAPIVAVRHKDDSLCVSYKLKSAPQP